MGQIIRSLVWSLSCVCMCLSLSVCVCVCPCSHGRNFEPISTKFGTDVLILKRKKPFVGRQNPIRVSPIFTQFYPKWAVGHPRNAFSMGDLKRFSDIIYGPIIAVRSSNNVSWRPPTPECEKRVKGGVARVTWPVNFWALNANSSKTAKGTNFKFHRHVPGIVATWPLRKVSETFAWPGSRDRDNSTVQTEAWDRYRVPQNVFLL